MRCISASRRISSSLDSKRLVSRISRNSVSRISRNSVSKTNSSVKCSAKSRANKMSLKTPSRRSST